MKPETSTFATLTAVKSCSLTANVRLLLSSSFLSVTALIPVATTTLNTTFKTLCHFNDNLVQIGLSFQVF